MVALLPKVLTRLVVVLIASRAFELGLNLAVVLRPRSHVPFLLLAHEPPAEALPREGVPTHQLGVLVDLVTGLGADELGQGAVVVAEEGVEHRKVRDLRAGPAGRPGSLAGGRGGHVISLVLTSNIFA